MSIKWIAGGTAAYATAGFTATDFNSLADGSVVVAATSIDNTTNKDMFIDVSFVFTVGGTTTASSYFSLYLLPLDQDGSTYGDAVANGSTAPVSAYWVANCGVKTGITSGNTVSGTFSRFQIPDLQFKLAIVNHLTVALNSSAAAIVKYETRNITTTG